MNEPADPWQIDVKNMNLEGFVGADGNPIDPALPFSVGADFHSGIYCYGPKLRNHSCGEVSLALDMQRALLVEIDRLSVERTASERNGELPVMKELSLVSGLAHRNLPETLASGVADTVPFVVRPFYLGRALSQLLPHHKIPRALAYGLLFVLTDLLEFLENQSPFPGAFSFGGITPEDIHLAYDGSIRVFGLGYSSIKTPPGAKPNSDRESLLQIIQQLEIKTEIRVSSTFWENWTVTKLRTELRKGQPDWCAGVRSRLATLFRTLFAQEIQKDRAFYGLQTLQ